MFSRCSCRSAASGLPKPRVAGHQNDHSRAKSRDLFLRRPAAADQTLIDKIRSLPPEKLAEVEDFVDFLKTRDDDRLVTLAAAKLSEDSFRQVWDNPDDAEYDRL
jgi:hypothetical protein